MMLLQHCHIPSSLRLSATTLVVVGAEGVDRGPKSAYSGLPEGSFRVLAICLSAVTAVTSSGVLSLYCRMGAGLGIVTVLLILVLLSHFCYKLSPFCYIGVLHSVTVIFY
jgi:hypothetical protein